MKLHSLLAEGRVGELTGIILLLLAGFVAISLATYHPEDLRFYKDPPNIPPLNKCGTVGAYVAGKLLYLPLGWSAWLLPAIMLLWAVRFLAGRAGEHFIVKLFGIGIVLVACASILAWSNMDTSRQRFFPGGLLGQVCYERLLSPHFGSWGSVLVAFFGIVVGLLLATEFRLIGSTLGVLRATVGLSRFLGGQIAKAVSGVRDLVERRGARVRILPELTGEVAEEAELEPVAEEAPAKPRRKARPQAALKARERRVARKGIQLPSLSLLNAPSEPSRETREDLAKSSRVLEETLRHFDVEAKVVQVNHGPVISSFELELAPGIRVSKVTTLSDDLALALKATSARIVAPVPGKNVVAVEIPNAKPQLVHLREILSGKRYRELDSCLPLALGKDIFGEPVVANLAAMPHLLIAGTTGSGKTVCMNSLILSILFRATPREVRFVMIDPKMVELTAFIDIPHLLVPVVTNPKTAAATLKWMVGEMERRYELLANAGAREIMTYNKMVADGDYSGGEAEDVVTSEGELPCIVVIIDELADLMAIAQASVEDSITRLAQLSRAVGIHLLLATQRPSVDVITGIIKANFPYRISFQVSSKTDSRTVLDMNGAEKLLGKGDMLYLPPGQGTPIRVQGSLVSDSEIERVVEFLKEQEEPVYREGIVSEEALAAAPGEEGRHGDLLYDDAVRIVTEIGHASVSMLQRRLSIGYSRAARMIDRMEEDGIIGASRGSKPRQVIMAGRVEHKGG